MNNNTKELNNWIDLFLNSQDLTNRYKKDKYEHCYRTSKIANMIEENNKLLEVAMKFHDIGRFIQYDKIQSFDDNILSHYKIGREYIEELEKKKILKSSEELEKIKNIIEYHLGIKYIPNDKKVLLDEETLRLIDLSSIIDATDNGCVGAVNYIENEIINDEKNYKINNPNLDMKDVSYEVLEFYLNNYKFNKFEYCKTYADYILYAIILMIYSLYNGNKKISVEIIRKEDTINKYIKIIEKNINPTFSKICIEHLENIKKEFNINP